MEFQLHNCIDFVEASNIFGKQVNFSPVDQFDRIYLNAQSVSSQIRVKVGVGVNPRYDSH